MKHRVREAVRFFGELVVAIPVLVFASPLWFLSWKKAIAVGRFYGAIGFFFYVWPERVFCCHLAHTGNNQSKIHVTVFLLSVPERYLISFCCAKDEREEMKKANRKIF